MPTSHTYHFPLVLRDKVHLVDEAEDFGIGGELENGLQTRLVIVHVLLNLTTLNIKHIDENLNITKHILPLASEVVVHEHFLPGGRGRGRDTCHMITISVT